MDQTSQASPAHDATTDQAASGDRKVCIVSYALMLATPLLGITPLIALIVSYVSRGNAEPIAKSHHGNIIKTFWLGLLLSIVLAVIYGAFMVAMLTTGAFGITLIAWIGAMALTVWVYIRMIKGLLRLLKDQPWV